MHERMSEGARAALLKETPAVEAALERVLAALDDSSTKCTCCNLVVFNAFRDHQLAENVRGTLTKLRRWRGEVESAV